MKHLILMILALLLSFATSFAQVGAINGPNNICIGSTGTETDTTAGGTWSSSNLAIGTVGPSTGVVLGISAGVINITYTVGSVYSTYTVTVDPAFPGGITGPSTICSGQSVTDYAPLISGTWSSSNPAVAAIGSSFGIINGVSAGTSTITYSIGGSCFTTWPVTVNPSPAPIAGPASLCPGTTVTLSDATPGGTFLSGITTIATVGSTTGIVTGGIAGLDTITYTLSSTGCIVTKPITVNPIPGPISGPVSVCNGSCITLTAGGGGTWITSGGFATVGAFTGSVCGVSAGVATITYTVSTGCFSTTTVIVNLLPTVYSVTGGGTYCSGGTGVNVGLSGSQTGVSYQLYVSGTPIGSPVSGTGTAISFGLHTGAGIYTVVATNGSTACTATMIGSATVTVSSLPTLYSVTGGGSYCSGGSGVSVGLSGSQTGVNYQLYNGLIPVGSPLPGTGAALNFGMFTLAATYIVIANNPATGCTDTMNGSATITISSLTLFTVSGGGSYCAGGTGGTGFHIYLSGSTSGVIYQLYMGSVLVGPPLAGTGGTMDFGSYSTIGIYSVTGTDGSTTCTSLMTGTATISVNPLPVTYSVTGGGAYCTGGAGVNVGLSFSTPGITYQLYNGTISVGATTPGSGAGLSFGLQTTPGTYIVVATNSTTGCSDTMTGSAIVSVTSLPSIYSVTGGGNYCTGGSGVNVGLSGSSSGTTYQLYLGGTAYGSVITGTGSALSFGLMTTAGSYTVSATGGTGCSGAMSGSVTVVVDPLPTVYTVTGGGSYCAGGAGVSIGLSGSQTGVNYQLYRGGTVVGSTVSGSGSAISFGMQTAAGSYTVHATNVTTTCSNTMTGSAIVVISPLPTVYTIAGGGSYCSGGAGFHITLSGSVVGISYQLYLGGIAVGSPLSGTGGTLDFGVFTGTGTYTIVATDGTTTCVSSMSGSVVIAVNPLPIAYSVTGGGTYCSGGSGMAIALSGSQVGVSYQLYLGGVAVGAAVTGTGASISFGMHTASGTYTVGATNLVTLCTNIMTGGVTIGVLALPIVYTITGGGSYCSGGAGVHIGLSNSDAGINYQLYNGTTAVGSPTGGTGTAIDCGLQTGAGVYTVVATNATTFCSDNMTGSVTVTIMPTTGPPVVSISASPGLSVCAGTTVTFTATPTVGGTSPGYQWSVNGTAVTGATNATYSYMPVAGDLVGITLTSSSPCVVPATATATVSMTVTAMVTPTVSIVATPGTTVCAGATVLYSTTVTGGGSMPIYSWAVNGVPTGATSSTYSFVPIAGDVIEVYITSSATCVISPTASDSVNMTIDVPTITASTASAGCGPTQTLTAGGGTSYSWMPTTGLSCTTCSSPTLIPAATTQYTVTGTDGLGCSGSDTVTVDGNRISGYITYTGTTADTFTVWLIQFNPIDSSISATDSTSNCFSSGTPYYEFLDKPAGNYLVKAKLNSAVSGTSGYIPTYSLSTSHWYSAASVAHTSTYDTMHINMIYGTVPPGPGFIAGYVVSGAGRNTSADAPAKGMIIYLTDTNSHLLSFTYTDSAGLYSFRNLTEGSYRIYPENYKYYTTPSAIITLAPGSDSATTIDFRQYTTSGMIRPYDNSKTPVITTTAKGICVYPNPASGVLNIRSDKASEGVADIILTDITGREVLKNKADLNAATGNTISLNGISAGVYLITIKSDKVFYSDKLVIEQ